MVTSAIKENKAGEIRDLRQIAILNKIARERFTEMIFEQKPERDEDLSHAIIWWKSILNRRDSKCKGPKVETVLYGGMSNGEERKGENSKITEGLTVH